MQEPNWFRHIIITSKGCAANGVQSNMCCELQAVRGAMHPLKALGNLNQVVKALGVTIRAMADGGIDSQVGARAKGYGDPAHNQPHLGVSLAQ